MLIAILIAIDIIALLGMATYVYRRGHDKGARMQAAFFLSAFERLHPADFRAVHSAMLEETALLEEHQGYAETLETKSLKGPTFWVH